MSVRRRCSSAVVTALRLVSQGPGFEPGLSFKACYMPSSLLLNEAKPFFCGFPSAARRPSWSRPAFKLTVSRIVVIGCGLTPVKILFRLRLQKNCPRRNTTTTCKGTAHGLTYKMNVYIKFNKKNIYLKKLQKIYL
jgi:hypothetical protein